mmetsp:Transcript_7630/g.18798  ORF Transcript_7630/g.18798 Transcript_7630/m.18798 type:complete len:1319 (+) Transcript_7630:555-4511(+)
MDKSLEMLTPVMMEERRQARNKDKFHNLRKSMGVVENDKDEKSLSDSGRLSGGFIMQSPSNKFQSSNNKGHIGSAPSYLSNVRLRKVANPASKYVPPGHDDSDSIHSKTESVKQQVFSPAGSPVGRNLTYRERRELELNAQREEDAQTVKNQAPASPASVKTVERKMTYRERREMELKVQREKEEEKAADTQPVAKKLNYRERRELELKRQRELEEKTKLQSPTQSTPKQDVASLIRKRISANKKTATLPQNSHHSYSNTVGAAGQRSDSTPEAESAFSQNRSSHSNRVSNPTPERNASTFSEQMSSNQESGGHVHGNHESESNEVTSPPPQDPSKMLNNFFGARAPSSPKQSPPDVTSPPKDPSKVLNNLFASRAPPSSNQPSPDGPSKDPAQMLNNLCASRAPPSMAQENSASPARPPHQMLENFLSTNGPVKANKIGGTPTAPKPDVSQKVAVADDVSQVDAKSMLSGFLAKRSPVALPPTAKEGGGQSVEPTNPSSKAKEEAAPMPPPQTHSSAGGLPALKDDPKFERYFRMLKMGLPLDVAKHAMVRDGLDPSVLDMDPNKSVGLPLKDDPKYSKYFKMLKIGISIEQVKHSVESDGLNPEIMDQDHNLPAISVQKKQVKRKKESHRRARLHWKAIGKVLKNSLWDSVQSEVGGISIDEDEFEDLFQADLKASNVKKTSSTSKKKGPAVRVIDSKRANNGGIILARVKLTHDQMAEAVDRIDPAALTAQQIEHIIEYLPTKEEREALEQYMLNGGQDAAENFDGLCECEKFMVSMMTVKHVKRKVRALLFKLQFRTCMESIAKDAQMIDTACDELINSNRLRQLLGIILQFGNRLNTAGNSSKSKAGGFSLESLSKLSQAKAFDKKTTFLHYVILILERNNELLLKFYDDIPTVLEAENIFWDQCQQDLEEVENQLENVRRISLHEAKSINNQPMFAKTSDDDSLGEMELTLEEEVVSLRATQTGQFTLGAIKQVSALRERIERTKAKCVRLKQYFGVTSETTEPQEIFSVFVKFTTEFKKAKEQVFSTAHKRLREDRKKARQKTPKKPKNPKREPMMKASSHQPNMNKLFSDIQQRQPSNINTRQESPNDVQSSRAGLLSSIKERQSPSEGSGASPSPRSAMMNTIKKRNTAPGSGGPPSRAGLFDAIKQRNPPSQSSAPASRAGLMDAITQPNTVPKHHTANPSGSSFVTQRQQRSPVAANAPRKPSPPRPLVSHTTAAGPSFVQQRQPRSPKVANASSARTASPRSNATPAGSSSLVTQRRPRSPMAANPIETQVSPRAAPKPNASRTPRDSIRNHRRRFEAARAARHGR